MIELHALKLERPAVARNAAARPAVSASPLLATPAEVSTHSCPGGKRLFRRGVCRARHQSALARLIRSLLYRFDLNGICLNV